MNEKFQISDQYTIQSGEYWNVSNFLLTIITFLPVRGHGNPRWLANEPVRNLQYGPGVRTGSRKQRILPQNCLNNANIGISAWQTESLYTCCQLFYFRYWNYVIFLFYVFLYLGWSQMQKHIIWPKIKLQLPPRQISTHVAKLLFISASLIQYLFQ